MSSQFLSDTMKLQDKENNHLMSTLFQQDSNLQCAAYKSHLTRLGGLGLSVIPGSFMATMVNVSEAVVSTAEAPALSTLRSVKVLLHCCQTRWLLRSQTAGCVVHFHSDSVGFDEKELLLLR